MRSNTLTSWFLLALVVLFWNLGPSLHHADIFGFHSQAQENSSGCCCCSHHHPVNSDGDSSDGVGQHCHRSLCDFFDQLHLVIEIDAQAEAVELVALASVVSDQSFQCGTVSPQARGPPLA